jgi:lambda family phage portal protein
MAGIVKSAMSYLFGSANRSGMVGNGRAYDAGDYWQREMGDWYPTIGSADDEILDSRDLLVARARALYRNHPVIHGAVNKIADAVVGSRIMLDSKPMHDLLNKSLDWAIDWTLKTQAEFKVWAYSPRFDCDIMRQNTLGQMARTAFITRFVDGECIAVIRNKPRDGRYTTCIELVDPDRLSNPNGYADHMKLPNGNTIYAGIEFNDENEPVAYHFRVKHPATVAQGMQSFTWVRIARYSPNGKPQVVHSFRAHRPNQRRGVSSLTSVIKRVRMNDNYDVAELEAALFDAVNAGFVESPYPSSEVGQAMAPVSDTDTETGWSLGKQITHRLKNAVSLKGVRMIHGLPGEKFHWKAPARPAANYPAFKGAGQHDMAAGVGLSYPQISEDWADINYSSARTLLNEKWRGFDAIGEEFCSQFLSPIQDAWLEEAVAIGTVKVPGGSGKFYELRALLGYCGWLRPGRGTIDGMKEEQAADIAINGGRSNEYIECARNGLDFYEVALGKRTSSIVREKLGIEQFVPLKVAQGSSGQDAADTEENSNEESSKKPAQRGNGQ